MKTDFQTVQALMDIEAPLAPPASNLPTVIVILVLAILLLALVTLAVRHLMSNRAKALRKLKRLRKNSIVNDTSNSLSRNTAFQLAHTLSLGFNINGVTSNTALPAELNRYEDKWQKFLSKLSQSRFATPAAENTLTHKMFDDAYFWLKNWP